MTLLNEETVKADLYRVEIEPRNIALTKRDAEKVLGYPKGAAPAWVIEAVEKVITRAYEMAEIQAGYTIVQAEKPEGSQKGLMFGPHLFNTERIVTAQLKKSEQVAAFICTIGPKMETWSRELMEDDPFLGYAVNMMASVFVDRVADQLHAHIREKTDAAGLNSTNRYSPGYCEWPVAEQHMLFSLFPEKFCGITLTPSSLMLPIKSISGVIGIGTQVQFSEYVCAHCTMKSCPYRKK